MGIMLRSVAQEEEQAVHAGGGTYLRDVLEQNRPEGMRSPRRWVRRLESLQELHASAREADARRVRQLAEEHRFVLLHKLRPHRRFLALQELAHRWSAEDVWVLGKGTIGRGGHDEDCGVDLSDASILGLTAQVGTWTGTARRLQEKMLKPQSGPHWGVSSILVHEYFNEALHEQRDPAEYEPVPVLLKSDARFTKKSSRSSSDAKVQYGGGFVCDGCDVELSDLRYNSSVVEDFDLCPSCFGSKEYESSHGPFIARKGYSENHPMYGLQGDQLYWDDQ